MWVPLVQLLRAKESRESTKVDQPALIKVDIPLLDLHFIGNEKLVGDRQILNQVFELTR